MIFVDTSVWVETLRSARSLRAAHLRELLDADQVALSIIVRLELLAGARRSERGRLERVLSALPLYTPSETTWATIATWVEKASDSGERFGIGDLLIGAIAAEHGGAVWTLDRDFARMAQLGFIRLHIA